VAAGRSALCHYNETHIYVRDRDLCADLIGKISLIDYVYFLILGKMPSGAERAIVEAALVALAEHGLTPSVIAARLTYTGAPESLQGAVAAGILGVGDQFVGTVEQVAPLLVEIAAHPDGMGTAAQNIVDRIRSAGALVPGFGQPHHKPDDPRSPALFAVGERHGVNGRHVAALRALSAVVDKTMGRHLTINAPAAISSLFLEIGIPVRIMRGFVLISRCVGLVAHLREEQTTPAGRALWVGAQHAVEVSDVRAAGKPPDGEAVGR
jgi:citrate synthase